MDYNVYPTTILVVIWVVVFLIGVREGFFPQ
jgi:hypothetical protein